jgi:hypothetical protein
LATQALGLLGLAGAPVSVGFDKCLGDSLGGTC